MNSNNSNIMLESRRDVMHQVSNNFDFNLTIRYEIASIIISNNLVIYIKKYNSVAFILFRFSMRRNSSAKHTPFRNHFSDKFFSIS